jgi:hypothetical protein
MFSKPASYSLFTRDSGVGDHGLAGIKSILKGHVCGAMCEGLQMGEEHTIGEELTKKPRARGRAVGAKKKGKNPQVDSDDSEYFE